MWLFWALLFRNLNSIYFCMNSKLLHENQRGNIEAWELVSFFTGALDYILHVFLLDPYSHLFIFKA